MTVSPSWYGSLYLERRSLYWDGAQIYYFVQVTLVSQEIQCLQNATSVKEWKQVAWHLYGDILKCWQHHMHLKFQAMVIFNNTDYKISK